MFVLIVPYSSLCLFLYFPMFVPYVLTASQEFHGANMVDMYREEKAVYVTTDDHWPFDKPMFTVSDCYERMFETGSLFNVSDYVEDDRMSYVMRGNTNRQCKAILRPLFKAL
jgi:hypothetical protein